jgi:predicted DsbA family dithiol-disulfide isomerase
LKQEYDVEITWEPFELNPDVPPEGMPTPVWIRDKWRQAGNRVRAMAQEAGLPMVQPDWTPNTRRAHEANQLALAQGRQAEFHRKVFHKYYGEGLDIGSWDVLREAAVEAGLDSEEMQRAVDAGEYRQIVEEKFERARELGISGVPLYVFEDQYAISGAQPYDVFRRFMDRYVSGGPTTGG